MPLHTESFGVRSHPWPAHPCRAQSLSPNLRVAAAVAKAHRLHSVERDLLVRLAQSCGTVGR